MHVKKIEAALSKTCEVAIAEKGDTLLNND